MEYRKENHFIVAYDGEKVKGKWDIRTNQYIGVKGSIVKHKPVAFSDYQYTQNMDIVFQCAINLVAAYCNQWHAYTPERANRLEQIISVGLKVQTDWNLWNTLGSDKLKLTKDFVRFLNENYNGVYSFASVQQYKIYKQYSGLLDKCTGNKDWAINVLKEVNEEVPLEFVKGMVLRAIHEKVFYSTGAYNFGNMINDWYKMLTELGDKLEVKHNILTNDTILRWIYHEFKMAHYDEDIEKNNNLPWLYFKDERLVAYPLRNRAEFHEEAEAQGNCVERLYMDAVRNGRTHVVVVRKLNDPERSFITCEVNNNGAIMQYLYRYNRQVTASEDIIFQQAYQNYLYDAVSSLENES